MDIIKKHGPSAVLAVVGMKAAQALGVRSAWGQIAASVAGAFGGILLANKL